MGGAAVSGVIPFAKRQHECVPENACVHGKCWTCCDQAPCSEPAPLTPPAEVAAAVGAIGAGIFEPKLARRAEDRDRFDAQARAWKAFREVKAHGGDDADALATALDVYHQALAAAAVRRMTTGGR